MSDIDMIAGATCDTTVEPYGTAQLVAVMYSQPRPIAAEGYEIVSYEPERCPRMTPSSTSYVMMGGSDLYSYEAAANSYFGYDCFTDPIFAQVTYGSTASFALEAYVDFDAIVVRDAEGVSHEISNVSCAVHDNVGYVQHQQTGGWGSEDQKNLFIPWQDIR